MRTKIAERVEGYESLELFIDPSENIFMPQPTIPSMLRELHQDAIDETPASNPEKESPVPCERFKPRWWPVDFPEEI
jgi:hypothetical protein